MKEYEYKIAEDEAEMVYSACQAGVWR